MSDRQVAGRPSGRVIAFELRPAQESQVERDIEMNGFKNVTVTPYALADKTGETLYFPFAGLDVYI